MLTLRCNFVYLLGLFFFFLERDLFLCKYPLEDVELGMYLEAIKSAGKSGLMQEVLKVSGQNKKSNTVNITLENPLHLS